MIRVGTPRKYKPTKLSELPKPQKIKPTNITNHTVAVQFNGKDLASCTGKGLLYVYHTQPLYHLESLTGTAINLIVWYTSMCILYTICITSSI